MGRLLDAIEKIPAERRQASMDGEWTVKEVLAHAAAWDREVAAAVDDVLAGHAVRFWGWDENVFNAEVARAARPATLEQVLDELRRAHSALVEKLDGLTAGQWSIACPHSWSDGRPMTVASVFGYEYAGQTHYAGHAAEIEEWLTRQGS